MAGIARYPLLNAFASFIDAPDSIYGTGMDGSITLDGTNSVTLGDSTTWAITSSNLYTATRDLYFNNLTLNANVRLDPNGYRIFVKNLLTFNSSSIIGFASGFSGQGSIYGGGAAATSVICSLGGNGISSPAGTTYTATAPTALMGGTLYFQQPRQAVLGYSLTAAAGTNWLRGRSWGHWSSWWWSGYPSCKVYCSTSNRYSNNTSARNSSSWWRGGIHYISRCCAARWSDNKCNWPKCWNSKLYAGVIKWLLQIDTQKEHLLRTTNSV